MSDDPWKKETCAHCGKVDHACYLEHHDCVWFVWTDGNERWPREHRGFTAEDVARNYAFWDEGMYRGHWLCDTDYALTVYVHRKNSDVVTPFEVRGHWQPQYSAHAGKPFTMKQGKVA